MHRKLTITVADDVYQGLHHKIGRGEISRFIENLVRPLVVSDTDLETTYRAMAADVEREREAAEWVEADLGEWPEWGVATCVGSTSNPPVVVRFASDDRPSSSATTPPTAS